jgi:rubrerythrin
MNYSVKEIIDMAIEMEVAGNAFYVKCADQLENEKISDIFRYLASEELLHKKKFESMLNNIPESAGMFTDEYYLYLKAIGGDRVFGTEAAAAAGNVMTAEEAVKKGFHDEKNSILFYTELKELYQDRKEIMALLDSIIDEERKHVAALLGILNMIKLSKGS